MTTIDLVMYLRICKKKFMLIHFFIILFLPHFPQILNQELHSHILILITDSLDLYLPCTNTWITRSGPILNLACVEQQLLLPGHGKLRDRTNSSATQSSQ